MKRIIFCTQVKFPRGDAGANRVFYMAKAMAGYGFDVTVISTNLSTGENLNGELKEYGGIKYTGFRGTTGKLSKLRDRFWRSANNTVKVLKKLNLNDADNVIVYSSGFFYLKKMTKYLNKMGVKAYVDIVEHHQRFQYDSYLAWLNYKNAFKISGNTGNVIAISEHIKAQFEDKCDVVVLPVFTDKEDYNAVVKEKTEKTFFIYPGNAHKKDDMKTMVSAFASLSDEEKQKVEFHVTSTNEEYMRKMLGDDYYELIQKTKDCVFIHSWLEYEDLINLCKKAQFLLLARPDNIVTQANFPSKVPELMITGIIPIISKFGDVVNYLSDGVDSIFMENPTTVEICKEAIVKAMSLTDEELKAMSINARRTAEEKFDYRNWSEKMGEIFG